MSVNIYDSSNDTLVKVPGTETSAFTGATSSAAGTKGLVPAPAVGDEAKVLGGDGTWLDVDTTPTEDGTNPVSSGAAYALKTALSNQKADKADVMNGNAGAHNAIYRGKSLGTSVTAAQYTAISAGTFDDMFIGDYWVINSITWRIAAFDYWYNNGDTACTTHHVLLVPDTNLVNAKMNDTNITTGGYVGSDFYTGNNGNTGYATAKNTINTAFGSSHILNHREYLINAVADGHPSGCAWYDSTVELMNENMVYGSKFFEPMANGSAVYANYNINKSQLPLFQHRHDLICNRASWWLRSVVSSAYFAFVASDGVAGAYGASLSVGVRPAFAIKA
jgi:hypothetical protein